MLKHIRICQSSARRNLTPRLQPLAWQVPHVKKSFYQGQEPVCLLHCSSGLESQSFGQSNSRCSLLGSTRQLMCLAIPRKLAATAAEQQPTADASPLKSRDLLRGRAAFFEFKVNGVSFHSRQQFVHGLEADDAIMMIPEPENKHDAFAIAVTNMEGQMLGYVPKDINRDPEFKGGVLFGHVSSKGPVPDNPNMKGFKVVFQPKLRPLHVVIAPKDLAPTIQTLEGLKSEAGYLNLFEVALRQANGRCQISGASCKELAVVPEWFEDTKHHKYILQRLVCMSPQLQQARDSILQKEDSEALQIALFRLRLINGWVTSEIEAYVRYLRALEKQRVEEAWTIDTGLLQMGQSEE